MNKEQVDCISKYMIMTLSRPVIKEQETINNNIIFPEKRRNAASFTHLPWMTLRDTLPPRQKPST